MNKYKIVILGLTTVILTACSSLTTDLTTFEIDGNEGAYRTEIPAVESAIEDSVNQGAQEENSVVSPKTSIKQSKIVSVLNLEAESKDLSSDVSAIEDKVHELNGYIGSHNIDTANNLKRANMSIRIPKENHADIADFISKTLSITAESSESIDVTESYYDTESRVQNLSSQEEKLRDLYDKAESVEDMLLIDERLATVTSEKEELTKKLIRLEERSSYATIELNINEVKDFTMTEAVNESTSERINNALSQSVISLKNSLVSALVFIANYFIYIVAGVIGFSLYTKHLRNGSKTDDTQKTTEHDEVSSNADKDNQADNVGK